MTLELNFRRSDFPTDWNDNTRMNFLFSPFRERSVNPEGYDGKMNFWINTIQDLCLKHQSSVISNTSLSAAFERKNRQPVCLDIVLDNMIRQGLIIRMSDYTKVEHEKGWLGWGFDILIQRPVSWGFSSVHGLLNLNKTEEKFIILSVVKDLSSKIEARFYELMDKKWTDNAMFLKHLKQECKDICTEQNFNFAVIQLQREKKASVFEEDGEKIIKFRKLEEKKIEPLSEVDKGVLSLKRARDTLLHDIEELEASILSCDKEVRKLMKEDSKSKAKQSLMKKKRLETSLKKKSITLDNIENLLCQLKNTGTEKLVLDAYRTGVLAMKRTTTGELDLDNIDAVMSDVQGVLDDYNEVQSTLSKSVTADESLEELEKELQSLIGEEKERKESPSRVSDDELLKRLEALRAPPEDISPVKKPALQKPLRAP